MHVAFLLSLWDGGRIAISTLAKCDEVALNDCDHIMYDIFIVLLSREYWYSDCTAGYACIRISKRKGRLEREALRNEVTNIRNP